MKSQNRSAKWNLMAGLQGLIGAGLAAVLGLASVPAEAAPKHLLVVTVTKGFRHSSIPTAEKVIADLAQRDGSFTVDFVRDDKGDADDQLLAAKTTRAELAKYDGVIFANTTGELPLADKEYFLEWIQSGKAFIGMHSATDTFHKFQPFIEMLGGEFLTHGPQVEVAAINEDPKHPACKNCGFEYVLFDEIYLFKNFNRQRVHGLLTLDKHPNRGFPGDFPVAWCKEYGAGRVFYTSLGHREDVWDPDWTDAKGKRANAPEIARTYQDHILGGIRWALKLERGDGKPVSKRAALSAQELADGFVPLFNGETLAGWRLRNPNGLASWSAQNGMLVNTIPDQQHGTDLVSEQSFRDFVIRYEYMIPKASNSGLYLRGRHEIQIYDDYEDRIPKMGGNGAIYSVRPASAFVSRRPGQWQSAEATIRGNRISVTLNGVPIHTQVEVNRATGGELDANLNAPGPILLQGDHGAIAFRNIRIKVLH